MQESGPFDKTIIVSSGQNPILNEAKTATPSSDAALTSATPSAAPIQNSPTATNQANTPQSPIQLNQPVASSGNSCLKWTCGCGIGCLIFIFIGFGILYYFISQVNWGKTTEDAAIKFYELLRDGHVIEEFMPKDLSPEEKKDAVKFIDIGVNCYKQTDETSKNQIIEQLKAFSKKDPNSMRDLKDFFNKVPPSFNECLTQNGLDVPSIQNSQL